MLIKNFVAHAAVIFSSVTWLVKEIKSERETERSCFIVTFAWKTNEYENVQLSNSWFIGKVKANVCISEMSSVCHAYKKFLSVFQQHAQYHAKIAWICHSDASKETARDEHFWAKFTQNSYNKLSATCHCKYSIFRKRYDFWSHILSGGSIS